jgi:protein involved in polysaccharide export with SLBB domain
MTRDNKFFQELFAANGLNSMVKSRRMTPGRCLRLSAVAAAWLTSTLGCGSPPNVQPLSSADLPVFQAAANFPHEKYVIVPDDTLQIRYTFHNDMSQEVVVQPDGKITATLVGQVVASGMTTAKLEQFLVEKTSDRLRNPEVIVSITKFAERNVYVGGEVAKPGMVRYRQGLTPLQAIIAAGGFLESARADSVVLTRTGESSTESVSRALNIRESVSDGAREPLFLAPHDVVYVPRTSIAEANLWVKQHVTDLFPFLRGSVGAGYSFRSQ